MVLMVIKLRWKAEKPRRSKSDGGIIMMRTLMDKEGGSRDNVARQMVGH